MRIDVSSTEKLILRTAGIFLRNGSVLLHRAEHEDIWALPGGGCDFFEDSKTGLIREMDEELKASIRVSSLAFFVENFFEWNGKKAHEIGFYYLAEFVGDAARFYDQDEFVGIEDKMEGFDRIRLFFKWFPLNALSQEKIKPSFLKDRLQKLGQNPLHIVHRDHFAQS